MGSSLEFKGRSSFEDWGERKMISGQEEGPRERKGLRLHLGAGLALCLRLMPFSQVEVEDQKMQKHLG